MESENIIFNMKRSPIDERDWILKNENIELPKILDYRKDLLEIRNQGNQGTCLHNQLLV